MTGGTDLRGLVRAFTQIQSRGQIQQEEINQAVERAGILSSVFTAEFGSATAEGIRASLGDAGLDEFFRRFTERASQIGRAPEDSSSNIFLNFRNALREFQAEIGRAILPTLTQLVERWTDSIRNSEEFNNSLRDLTNTIDNIWQSVA